jgi:uncharacterized protein YfaS (alpha-2-macroglobulin family)
MPGSLNDPARPSNQPVSNPDSLWIQVDSLVAAGLPKSALELVNTLYDQARFVQDDPGLVKAILNRIRLQSEFMENPSVASIQEAERELAVSREPVTQVLHSILGELYGNFLRLNQYRFRDRSFTEDMTGGDFQTWDLNRLTWQIILHYRQSLTGEHTLQSIPVEKYSDILQKPDNQDTLSDPRYLSGLTLFDLLARRALDFFTGPETYQMKSRGAFIPDNPGFFSQPSTFVRYPLQPEGRFARPGGGSFVPPGNDSLTFAWYALRIFQALAAFHLNDSNPDVLIRQELSRFSYVLGESNLPARDSFYLAGLKQFEQDYLVFPSSTRISFALAQKLMEDGSRYNPLWSADHKWDVKSAEEVCNLAVGRFPGSPGARNCRALIGQILASSLQVTGEYAVIPEKPALVSVAFRNLDQLNFRVVRADYDQFRTTVSTLEKDELFQYLTGLPVVKQWIVTLPNDGDRQEHRTEWFLPSLEPGYYVLIASSDSAFRSSGRPFAHYDFWSSRISYVFQREETGGISVFLLDRGTGRPLKNLRVEAFSRTYDSRSRNYITVKTGEYFPDESGYFTISPPGGTGIYSNLFLKIRDEKELLVTEQMYVYPVTKNPVRPVEQTRFFTDRAIYRPGQTIFFKGIILEQTGDSVMLKPRKTTRVTLVDVNGQKIADRSFTTNAFGSFNGSFVAPDGVLTGEMRIFNESGSIAVSVEEYKRPSFEVKFQPVEGNYKLGETVLVKGIATGYAGNAIDEAEVSYRVVRSARFPYWDFRGYCPFPASPEVEIVTGNLLTQPDGTFVISFEAIPDPAVSPRFRPVFDFRITTDITDRNGETRSVRENLSVGYVSLLIDLDIPAKLNLEITRDFRLSSTNLNGRNTPALVQVTLEKLKAPSGIFLDRLWDRPDTMVIPEAEYMRLFPEFSYRNENDPSVWPVEKALFEKTLNTANDSLVNLIELMAGSPGSYRITLRSTDPFGQKVDKVMNFTAFDPGSRQIPVPEMNWFVPLTKSGEPGDTASFLIGSACKEVQVIWEVRAKDRLVSRKWLKLGNQQKLVTVPILEDYRGNFSVNVLFVRNNRIFQNTQVVDVPYSDKKLNITFTSFRDKLSPGQQEEWKIRISHADSAGADAEFLAAMYDRSLDVFRKNSWNFELFRRYFYANPWEGQGDFHTAAGAWAQPWQLSWSYLTDPMPELNWFGLNLFRGYTFNAMEAGMKAGRKDLAALPAGDHATSAGSTVPQEEASPDSGNFQVIPLRKDFRETAFFYPTLQTDSTGHLWLSFTAPDALTSWKILGLAHTKDLRYGLVEKELVTRKELMVFPNLPRFLRQGDTVVLTTRIVNLSDHEISGEASLNLREAITMQPLQSLILDTGLYPVTTKPFTIPAGRSTSVSWDLGIPVSRFISLLQVQVNARTGSSGDGEEQVLPVLPNRMLITESMPVPVKGEGTFRYTFDKLLNSGKDSDKSLNSYRLTLEFAANPAWYAVQALPALDETEYPCADHFFTAFYANCLAAHIAGSNPRIARVFESWRAFSPEALSSALERNEDLKSAVLQETPWILEATGERENRQKLGQFFDPNRLQDRFRQNMKKLMQMQYPSGGWPWFEGMPENRYISLNILTGLGRLGHLGVKFIQHDENYSQMVRNAVGYLAQELVRDYNLIKKTAPSRLKENHANAFLVKYFYARSFFSFSPAGSGYEEAFSYYKSQLVKYWTTLDISSQAMAALALYRLGDKTIPEQILKSLSEKALHSSESGMYWAVPEGIGSYRVPIETQAVIIEAFDEIASDQASVEEMKVWLLKQKQTQMWRTRQSTVDACYALLLRGADLLAADPEVSFRLGSLEVTPELLPDVHQEAGTGYFRKSWTGDEVKSEMGELCVTKSSAGVAWGGLYWQYFESLDQVIAHESPLKVDKQILVVQNNRLVKGTHPNRFSVGDQLIVRLVVTTDRNLEFVHLKDLRAAGLEPVIVSPDASIGRPEGSSLSGYRYQDGLGYYQAPGDLAMNFFFDYLPKGTYVFEYPLVVNLAGSYSTGPATIQCLYAPEFSAHSGGHRLEILCH